ncbi:phosphatidate cytidylyltransferase Ptp4 [Schizosaccharomyces octosporus yFS286]|uniref:Phosphatidate cytidylyltransferase Ptp4 n=1 Tax=Schizosaccharomyces octosporus (strain yFS286) TaxID=483514 RepID=S9Q3E3_SCHOY|nr:phosphatidate cytidylyltransferase Ptp4 [Schizosaccharomyces octosporus yFS286]EPX74188.1 phosphatidate cytidylyltransferase Ptp4 [Schizosaccharomyces octosporus yFS286]
MSTKLTWSQWSKKNELPRKLLHTSIGFITLGFQWYEFHAEQITPYLALGFILVLTGDIIRFQWPAFSRLYNRVMGPLMRESEKNNWNGVIFYLVGTLIVLNFLPEEIAVMSILLLSWCDTAASSFGRKYGKYTPKIAKNKSLAGSIGAFVCGVLASFVYWGIIRRGPNNLARQSWMPFPVLCVVNGLIGAVAEAMDVWGLDDNVVIPVVSGGLLYLLM